MYWTLFFIGILYGDIVGITPDIPCAEAIKLLTNSFLIEPGGMSEFQVCEIAGGIEVRYRGVYVRSKYTSVGGHSVYWKQLSEK